VCGGTVRENDEAYIDDVVVQIREPDNFINILSETFTNLMVYHWKLNSEKCVFNIPSGNQLRFLISNCSIEANPDKINTITRMKPPSARNLTNTQ
jgi:hypothetical protein